MICPIRKGGPCVEKECAWYDEEDCAVLGIAKALYSIGEMINHLETSPGSGINWNSKVRDIQDDDIPF